MDSSTTILHLSDLHVGKFFGFKSPEEFVGSVRESLEDVRVTPTHVLVTGDLTSIGSPEEMTIAASLLRDLSGRLGIVAENVLVCPGNHDLSWDETKAAKDKSADPIAAPKFQAFTRVFSGSLRSPGAPPQRTSIVRELPRSSPTCLNHEVFSLHYFEKHNMLVYALNSAVHETHEEENHFGYIGEEQLAAVKAAEDQFEAQGVKVGKAFKVVMVHHPMLAPDDLDGSGLRDPIYFYSWLRRRKVDLVLHGHQHYRRTYALHCVPSGSIFIGAGSAAVTAKHRLDSLSFNLVSFDAKNSVVPVSTTFMDFVRSNQQWQASPQPPFTIAREPSGAFANAAGAKLFPRLSLAVIEVIDRHSRTDDVRRGALDSIASDLLEQIAVAHEDTSYMADNVLVKGIDDALATCRSVFAVDVVGPSGWVDPVAFRYLAPQIKHYLKRNQPTPGQDWSLVVDATLGNAIATALANAKKEGRLLESITTFDNPKDFSWKSGEPTLQIARVLLWSKEELRSHFSEAVIEIHNAFRIPLFFIEAAPESEARRFDYIAMEDARGNVSGWYGARDQRYATLALQAGLVKVPDGINPKDSFASLLSNPKLMFAADARATLR